jgi:multidrug resistance efflux pump
VEIEISRLTIRSPIRGVICAINHWPQSAIRAGEPIVTLASEKGRYLVSYVRQEQHVEPKVGMDVDVRKRLAVSPTVRTIVERVGPQVEQIPEHLCRDPKMPEWGLPVRITLPSDFSGRPGELFEVTFKTRSKGNG